MVEKAVHLMSAGLDSPVAALQLIDAGMEPVLVFFDGKPYNTDKTRQTALELATFLAEIAGKPLKLYTCPHGETIKTFHEAVTEQEQKFTCVFCKRTYFRVARAIAEKEGADAISTGEIIGEQASQTIENLGVIQQAVDGFLVIRPLLCWDKQRVIDVARERGTYEISTRAARESCRAVPRFPATKTKLERYLEIEAKVDVAGIVDRVLKNAVIQTVQPNG